MPPRNISIIFLCVIFSLVCYAHALRNHYAGLFAEAMHIVETEHLEPVTDTGLFDAAMKGMIGSLDEHSAFLSDYENKEFQEQIDQQFHGVGIQVSYNEDAGFVMVEMPIFNSPAYKAGLQSGDLIISVDDEDTEKQKTPEVVKLMKGPKGEPVTIGIRRPIIGDASEAEEKNKEKTEDSEINDESDEKNEDENKNETDEKKFEEFEVTIVRDEIKVASVKGDTLNADGKWQFVLEEDSRIGYIRLQQFGKDSAEELKTALNQISGDVEGFVLDLRSNPGGSLDSAIQICDMFIDSGTIVSTRGRDKQVRASESASSEMVVPKELPMVIMINEMSASASEIVSACLQDHDRALIVGERSYGKGTVQNVIELESGRSSLKLTTASFWRPSGRNIHRLDGATEEDAWGVTPDEGYRVKMEREDLIKMLRCREARDIQNQKGAKERSEKVEKVDDPQLRKAIEYLQEQISLPKAA